VDLDGWRTYPAAKRQACLSPRPGALPGLSVRGRAPSSAAHNLDPRAVPRRRFVTSTASDCRAPGRNRIGRILIAPGRRWTTMMWWEDRLARSA